MLDVHPAHHAANSWRDFIVHIATIVLGLLIAIGLEQTVEYFHHRHLVAEARENIQHEMTENAHQLDLNLASIDKDAVRMKQNILILRQLRDHPYAPHAALSFNLAWSSFPDSAWRTARDTGALSYMSYDEVQHLSQLYSQQQYINTLGVTLFTDQAHAPAAITTGDSADNLRPAEIDDLLRTTISLSAQITALDELLRHFQPAYAEAARLQR